MNIAINMQTFVHTLIYACSERVSATGSVVKGGVCMWNGAYWQKLLLEAGVTIWQLCWVANSVSSFHLHKSEKNRVWNTFQDINLSLTYSLSWWVHRGVISHVETWSLALLMMRVPLKWVVGFKWARMSEAFNSDRNRHNTHSFIY